MKNNSGLTFEEVLESNTEKIYRICRIYATAPVEPQDLFQEVVYQVWKSFLTFKGKSNVDTWVYRIALNVCMRSKLKLEKSSSKQIRSEAIQYLPAENPVDEEEKERYQFLRECISMLNESDATIVILYLEALSYKEISAVTGLTENHIAVKMKRIKAKLFDCITPKLN